MTYTNGTHTHTHKHTTGVVYIFTLYVAEISSVGIIHLCRQQRLHHVDLWCSSSSSLLFPCSSSSPPRFSWAIFLSYFCNVWIYFWYSALFPQQNIAKSQAHIAHIQTSGGKSQPRGAEESCLHVCLYVCVCVMFSKSAKSAKQSKLAQWTWILATNRTTFWKMLEMFKIYINIYINYDDIIKLTALTWNRLTFGSTYTVNIYSIQYFHVYCI